MLRIAIVSTVRASFEDLKCFIHYHINTGFDKIYLFFDDPNDVGIKYADKFSNVKYTICDKTYWSQFQDSKNETILDRQCLNAAVGLKMAKKDNIDWLTHIDSDELVYPVLNIKEYLSETKADVLRMKLYEAQAESFKYTHSFEPILFRRQLKSNEIKFLIQNGLGHTLEFNHFLRAHTLSKVFFRVGILNLEVHIHGVMRDGVFLKTIPSESIYLLHYDSTRFSEWKRKWEIREKATMGSISLKRQGQVKKYYDACKLGENELIKVYQDIYFFSSEEIRKLKEFNFLEEIFIQKEKFEICHNSK